MTRSAAKLFGGLAKHFTTGSISENPAYCRR